MSAGIANHLYLQRLAGLFYLLKSSQQGDITIPLLFSLMARPFSYF
jgi:hypothetical protein